MEVYFEGIKIFPSTIGQLKNRAAFALPGVGIFVSPKDINNLHLLRHEFGHILQARKWGRLFFYSRIAPLSLLSAKKNGKIGFYHQDTWTEWSANLLSYNYFNKPADWDFKNYPLSAKFYRKGSALPESLNDIFI